MAFSEYMNFNIEEDKLCWSHSRATILIYVRDYIWLLKSSLEMLYKCAKHEYIDYLETLEVY